MENRIITYPNLDKESENRKVFLIQPTYSSLVQVFDMLQKNQEGIDVYLWQHDDSKEFDEWTNALVELASIILIDTNIKIWSIEPLEKVLESDKLIKYTTTRELLTYLQ